MNPVVQEIDEISWIISTLFDKVLSQTFSTDSW